MNIQILLSIQPQDLVNILNGNKTLELRKLLPKNFDELVKKYGGIWVNLYCAKTRPYLVETITLDYETFKKLGSNFTLITNKEIDNGVLNMVPFNILNGKVVARFWFDEYICLHDIRKELGLTEPFYYVYKENSTYRTSVSYLLDDLCLTYEDVNNYGKGKDLYAWHIKQLEIFDTLKELSDFYYFRTATVYCGIDCPPYVDEVKYTLRKAPQSFRYVYVKGEE